MFNAAILALQLLNNLPNPQIRFKVCLHNDFPYTITQLVAKIWQLAVPVVVATCITMCVPLR